MGKLLTGEEFDAIRSRAEKATKGPWVWSGQKESGYIPQGSYLGNTLIMLGDNYEGDWEDAAFIAHAREDIPALIAEVVQTLERLIEAESLLSDAHDLMDNVHCYDTDEYHAISRFLNGGDDDE